MLGAGLFHALSHSPGLAIGAFFDPGDIAQQYQQQNLNILFQLALLKLSINQSNHIRQNKSNQTRPLLHLQLTDDDTIQSNIFHEHIHQQPLTPFQKQQQKNNMTPLHLGQKSHTSRNKKQSSLLKTTLPTLEIQKNFFYLLKLRGKA